MYVRHTRHIRTFLPFVLVLLVWLLPLTVSADIGTEIGKFIYEAVVAATGTLLTVAAYIFESALTHFVWGFGQYYREFFGFAIETTWAVVRDLMNFMFIFGLIYIGFRFILNADDSQAKNNLVMLILAALLVNFSLFFAKAVVDISHLAAQQLQAPIETVSGDTDISYGNALLNSLQITSILSDDVIDGKDDVPFMWIIGVTILSGVLILVAAFTLAALGIMLFTRFIYLTFLLIFSPVMFLGWVFPGLQGWSKSWLNTFISQALLAPALLLCLYISLSMIALIGQINGVGDEPLTSLHGAPAEDSTTIVGNAAKNAVPFFILGIGFFIGSLIAAKKMGAVGASTAISVGKKIGNKARGYAVGGAKNMTIGAGSAAIGAAGRNTFGRSAYQQIQDHKAGRIKLSQKDFDKAKKQSENSFDPRRLGAWAKANKPFQVKKGGFEQEVKDDEKKKNEYYDSLPERKIEDWDKLSDDEKQTAMDKNQVLAQANDKRERAIKLIDQYRAKLKTASKEEREQLKEKIKNSEKIKQTAETTIQFSEQLQTLKEEEARVAKDQPQIKMGREVGGITGGVGAGTIAGGLLGGAGAAVAGGFAVGIPAGGLIASNVAGRKTKARTLSEKQRKRFGENGEKMAKKKKQKEDAKLIKEYIDDNSDSKDKKDESSNEDEGSKNE